MLGVRLLSAEERAICSALLATLRLEPNLLPLLGALVPPQAEARVACEGCPAPDAPPTFQGPVGAAELGEGFLEDDGPEFLPRRIACALNCGPSP